MRAQVALGRFAAAQRSSEELVALAETSRQGPFPLMAVAGAAMHRGNGSAAAAMAERALAEMRSTGGQAFEPVVILAVAQLQLGRPDEALATIESVQAHGADHPFTHAVMALVHAAHRAHRGSRWSTPQAVTHAPGATYLDEVFAYVAAAGAHAAAGHRPRRQSWRPRPPSRGPWRWATSWPPRSPPPRSMPSPGTHTPHTTTAPTSARAGNASSRLLTATAQLSARLSRRCRDARAVR